jgi:DNA-binding transcriptional LysR family regulator
VRLTTSGVLYPWEFEKDGRELKVRVTGQLVFNRMRLMLEAAAGHGIAFVIEDWALPYMADGRLERILADWCDPFDGYYLYSPSRLQHAPAFSLLVEALRYRGDG